MQVDDSEGSYDFSISSKESPAAANSPDTLWTPCEDTLGYLRSATGATIGAYEYGSDLQARQTKDGDAVDLDECYTIPKTKKDSSQEATGMNAQTYDLHADTCCLR